MQPDQQDKCPQCEAVTTPVVVMDKVHPHVGGLDLEYRLPGDRPSFWSGHYPTAGRVNALMCSGCGLIQLFGERNEPSA